MSDYTCQGSFWMDAHRVSTANTSCAAVDGCELLTCFFCIDQVANPTCNPPVAAALLGVAVVLVISAVSCLLCCCRPFCLLFRCLLSPRSRQFASRKGPARPAHPFRGARTRPGIVPGQRWRIMSLGRLGLILGLAIELAVNQARAGSEVVSVVAQSESCIRTETRRVCTVTSATTLTFLPAGQVVSLLVREEDGATLGTLNLVMRSLSLECIPESKAWLRSYRLETTSSKRAQRRGPVKMGHEVRSAGIPKYPNYGRPTGNQGTHFASIRVLFGTIAACCRVRRVSSIARTPRPLRQPHMKWGHALPGSFVSPRQWCWRSMGRSRALQRSSFARE